MMPVQCRIIQIDFVKASKASNVAGVAKLWQWDGIAAVEAKIKR